MTTQTITYASTTDTTAISITLAGLATSSGLVAGRSSAEVVNTSNLYLDALVTGQVTVGTTPTTGMTIAVYVWSILKEVTSTYTYPIATATALTGADEAATFEAGQLGSGAVKFAAAASTIATSDRAYNFAFNVAPLFGGVMPQKWGIFVTHSTVANLNATAGNHWFHYQGIKYSAA